MKKLKHALALALCASAMGAQAQTELTVYTALEADDLKKYAQRFNEDHPDIKINWVRDSTGIVTARLLAEKENPQADVVWALAGTSLLMLKNEDMLEPYAPEGLDQLSPKFRDRDEEPAWVGTNAWMGALCVNTIEAEKEGLPMPTSWEDLTKPVYKGHVVMPNPNSSGTGFLDVSAWLQMMGEDNAWNYMDGLHKNISRYTHSGSKPCKMAASGETAIGVSFAFRGARLKEQGAPLEMVFPKEGLGWEVEAAGIMKGTDKLEAAQTLVDWAISRKAMEMYNEGFAIVAMPGVAKPVKHFPANAEELIIDNDFAWAAENREAILAEWQRRYDGKSEAK
ncbi:putative 2-aminoethylphosphonate ABC transporter substrate-binding protein [Marinobacter daepoensis]|uniref:2-aminoethylphosphonate ABC transporter substrate-binding protein n=1 Tax=Marinobacter daepoensis TaxID=262077 RepID=A0ABS3BDV0_9GAMM|nr:putative 2-aminoethylphosphonate ABC transporter substrate-binding protein [Marinobacter daepoensis]MBN7770010.1 putative 2-aminoethylphosphonate ABC transporter substrate-binding protein [Marinobacter daepoensis]MBY6032568.1 putative 2-aminoethylphosphonate ABC transporter substrate-binding protein [Marinobacter daepoensis]MBY6080398.1 putative 2-aminoethylphosphonate ABC transporter substrate-binding protein [Marinobacter daepoensis]